MQLQLTISLYEFDDEHEQMEKEDNIGLNLYKISLHKIKVFMRFYQKSFKKRVICHKSRLTFVIFNVIIYV